MSKISQKEYLKKYLSIGSEPGKKKKRKKKSSVISDRVKIIDDDIDIATFNQAVEEDLHGLNEDAPQIVGVIDERPLELRIDDYRKSDLWKPVGSDANNEETSTNFNQNVRDGQFRRAQKYANKSSGNSSNDDHSPPRKRKHDDDSSPIRKLSKSYDKSKDANHIRRQRRNSDLSPNRKKYYDKSPITRDKENSDVSSDRKTKSDDLSPVRRHKRAISPIGKNQKNTGSGRRYRDDISPIRRKRKSSSSSPKRQIKLEKHRRHNDLSPTRRSKKDNSPNIRNKSDDISPVRRNRRDTTPNKRNDISPVGRNRKSRSPHRRNRDDGRSPIQRSRKDISPNRRSRKNSDPSQKLAQNVDTSPVRRSKRDIDLSPPRMKKNEFDKSPIRKTQIYGSPSTSRRDTDRSSTRRTKTSDDVSPNRCRRDSDESVVRRTSKDDSRSSNRINYDTPKEDRRINEEIIQKSDKNYDKRFEPDKDSSSQKRDRGNMPRKSRWDDNSDSTPIIFENIKSGLQRANELIQENEMLRKTVEEASSTVNMTPIVRDRKTGKIRDFKQEAIEAKKTQEKENELKAKYDKWGKGLKQVEDAAEKFNSDLHEMNKPLARYADDEDLERHLKEIERDGDPMLQYLRNKRRKTDIVAGKPIKPQFEGEFMPNRYGIRPGHRWDGVDRSNGYEKKWFEVMNSRRAQLEDAYKWSTEDM